MERIIMVSYFWPVFLVLTGSIMSWLIYLTLNTGTLLGTVGRLNRSRERACFDTAYLLGHLSSYTLRMVKVD